MLERALKELLRACVAHAIECGYRSDQGTARSALDAGLPWLVLLLLVAALLGALVCVARSELARPVMINLAALVIALAALEGCLLHQEGRGDGTRTEGTIVESFTQRDDVAYAIDANGLRVSPSSQGKAPAGCVVFFGDSVTFGEGVNDEQAYPYGVGLRGRGDYPVYNVAFSGYGPHRMLAGLQAGIAERIVPRRSPRFVHLTILEHVARVAGLAHWDRHRPRFRLDAGGRAVRAGNFDGPPRLCSEPGRCRSGWTGRWGGFRLGRSSSAAGGAWPGKT